MEKKIHSIREKSGEQLLETSAFLKREIFSYLLAKIN